MKRDDTQSLTEAERSMPGVCITAHRRLEGVSTSPAYPGAVTILTPLGNKVTSTLTIEDVERFLSLLAECSKEPAS